MTYKEIKNLIASLTYKKGVKFTVAQPESTGAVVAIEMIVHDVDNPEKEIVLMVHRVVPWEVPIDYLAHLLYQMLYDLEMHELNEWFRQNGQCVKTPHPLRSD